MSIKTAVDSFHNPHNCAEAVFYAFDSEDKTNHGFDLDLCGGGKAPNGECGALFAGKLLVSSDVHQEFEQAFAEKLGSTKCRELKQVHKVPCVQCVEMGAMLTEAFI